MKVTQTAVTATERGFCTFSRVDYEDAFILEVESHEQRTPEAWARAVLEGAPAHLRRQLRRAWLAMGLRLRPATPSSTSVLGWEIRRRDPDAILLGAAPRLGMSGEVLFRLDEEALVFASFVHHANPILRAAWARVTRRHVQTVTHLLERAGAEHRSQS